MPTTDDARRPDPAAFWNINIDEREHTVECPDFLRYCFENEKDRGIISTPDSEYHRLTWDEVKEYASSNRPDLFQRVPSELRKYRHFCHQLQGQYGSILDFILQERLKWSSTIPSADYFKDAVWTKFEMPEDPVTGLLVPKMQTRVDDFVESTFHKPCGKENVAWFRNWVSLKSVHAVEHFHVMLLEPDPAFVAGLTAGDEPLAVKLGYITR